MIFKNIESWDQKKVKSINLWLNILYFTLSFVAPILTILIMSFNSGDIKERWRLPIITLIIISAIVISASKFLLKKVEKMRILNLDGSYDEKRRSTKHILLLVSKAFIPLILLILNLSFATFLKESIEFYIKLLTIVLVFYISGMIVDNIFIAETEEELEIRDKVAESNAVERRKNNLIK